MKQTMRLFLLLLATILLPFTTLNAQTVWDGSVAESFAGGTGTEEDPYLIEDGAQLAYMGQLMRENGSQYKGVHFKLISNIILNEDVLTDDLKLNKEKESEFNKWLPIGDYNSSSDKTYAFHGYFDGGGYCISGVYCPDNYSCAGLFALINDGDVHDFALLDTYVKGSYCVGGLTGHLGAYESNEKGQIYNCYVEACVEGGSYTGIAIGHLGGGYAYIRNCYTYGRILSGSYKGSIAGYTDRGHSENCYSVCLEGANGTGRVFTGSASKLYHDATVNSSAGYSTGKTTEEMQSKSFAELLGEPFVYAEGNYPYIEGLPMIGEEVDLSTAGFRLTRGAFVNGKGSSIKYSREFNGTDVGKVASRAEAGETVYVKVIPHKRMLLTDGSLKLINDETGQTVKLTSVGENIWSFTMPEYSVSITAAFHRNPDLPLVWMGDVADSFAGGSGTQEDPYQISNGDELAYLAKLTMANGIKTKGVYYKLTADIILNEDVLTAGHQLNEADVNDFCKWTPIGHYISDSDLSQTFQGNFDGNGFSVSGVYYLDNEFAGGLFGHIYNGNVHDLSVLDTYVKASNMGGGIAGKAQLLSEDGTARVYNCYAEACVVGGTYMGIAVGYVGGGYSSVDHCYTYGRVSGSYAGGLVGYLEAGSVSNCYSVCKSGYNGVYYNYGTVTDVYYDSTVNSNGRNATAKTTDEMQSEEFADLLGDPFEFTDGNYPYIPGLRQIGQGFTDKTTGYRTNVGAMANANGCTIKFFTVDGDRLKVLRRSEAGEKVYLKPILTHHMLMAETSLVLINDATGKEIALEKEGKNIYSFTMPDAEVTVTARFYANPKQALAWDGSVADSFAGGTGTKEDPYLISNGAELAYLAQITNSTANVTKGQYYRLTDDIVLNADVLDNDFQLIGTPQNLWTPIGSSNNYQFFGDFDGANHVISGVYATTGSAVGLFGESSGCIHNLAVVDSYAYSTKTSAGIICGGGHRADSISISHCYVEGNVYGLYAGLLVGGDNGHSTVEYSYCYGVVDSHHAAGGLIGDMYANMNHCFSVAKIMGSNGYGLVKITHSNTFDHLYYDKNLAPINPGINKTNCLGKSTSEMQGKAFADLLGEPFAYSLGDYPYIPGLPKVGEAIEFTSAGYHVNIGTLTNTCGSSVGYYSEFDGEKVRKATRSANTGETVYLKVDLVRRMLLLDGTLKVLNDTTGQVLTLTKEAEGIWSFTMPDFSVTVSASFHRDPNLPDVWEGDIAPEFAEGEGTEDDPYLIHDGAELAYLAQLTNANGALTQGKYYKLVNDIYLNEDVLTDEFALNGKPKNEWTPIGKDDSHKFQGVFDGDNHYITGVYVPSGSNSGFFGYTNNAVIRNLSLLDTYVYGQYSGALVFSAAATDTSIVSRCYVEALASCSSGSYYCAGLVAILGAKCSVEYCYTSGALGNGRRGGLVYQATAGSTVLNSYSAMKYGLSVYTTSSTDLHNVYTDEDLYGGTNNTADDLCTKHTIEMFTTDFATRMGEPFEYVLGNYPYIPGLKKIGENRGWKTPEDPTHSEEGEAWDGTTSVIFASGTGTKDDPYIINNGAQLSYLAKLTNANGNLTKGKYYKLDADIRLNADSVLTSDYAINGTPTNVWEPIGKDENHKFQGVFEGNNHTISALYMPSTSNGGFFGYTNNATVRNLSLVDAYVRGSNTGALISNVAASDTSVVSHCFVESRMDSGSGSYSTSGLICTLGAKCTLENSYVAGLGYNGRRGALVYQALAGSTVRNCFSAMKSALSVYTAAENTAHNVYTDEDLYGGSNNTAEDLCTKHTIEMFTTDFATRMGEPFEYVLGNYPYIPGLQKIGEIRGWKTPEDPTHSQEGEAWDGTTSVIFASGTGTEEDPYIINNGAQLSYLAKLTNANGNLTKGRYYKLDADIRLNADSVLTSEYTLNGNPTNKWEPIGKDENHKFQGVFEGNNHTISAMYLPSASNGGLFGYTNNAKVRNLSLVDAYVTGSNTGALISNVAASDTSVVSHCFVESRMDSGSGSYSTSGLICTLGAKCTLENSYVAGLGYNGRRGALVYQALAGSTVRNCFSAMRSALSVYTTSSTDLHNVYTDEDLYGGSNNTAEDLCTKHTIEMFTTDFATRMGEPFEYVLGNYPYIPGLQKIGEIRGWKTPEDPTHGGAGGTWDGTTSVIFANGTGTKADPYIINNGAQLSYLAKLTNANGNLTKGKYYRLEADIKLNDRVLNNDMELIETPTNKWEPIGKDESHKFQGVFDGNSYTVSGIYMPSTSNGGFFGYVNDAEVRNLSIVDAYVVGSNTGALISTASATDTTIISRCFVEAHVNSAGGYYNTAGLVCILGPKCTLENSYVTGYASNGRRGGIAYQASAGSTVRNCYSAMKSAYAVYNPGENTAHNVYYDSDRCGTKSTTSDDFRSAETPEMLSTDFAARMGEPFEYAVGYYPYIYGLHKIDENGKAVIVSGYPLQLGKLENGGGCTIEFYRGYKKKTKELSLPVVPGSKVFVDNATTIYVKVTPSVIKRLSDEGLIVKTKEAGNQLTITEVDYDLYSFQITDDAVTVSAAFLDGNFCGDPEVNNGRNVRWQLNSAMTGLTIEGTGRMVGGLWSAFADSVRTIGIGEGVTNVPAQAFKGMSKATTATLPATLETIGTEAFSGCKATVDLQACTQLTALHANEFAQFSGTVYLPATVTAIEADAFSGTYSKVAHVYSPVVAGSALYANGSQVSDKDGWGDIVTFGIRKNEAVELQWYTGFNVNTTANADGVMACYADEALSKIIPNGMKALRADDQTPVYIKVTPSDTKILFLDGLTVKGQSGKITVTQVSDEVFSFMMPAEAVTISANYATGGYCGASNVNNGHNLIWTLNNGTLAFQKNGFAQGADITMGGNAPWKTLGGNVKKVDLDGVTNVGDNAFASCTNLVGLELPASPVVTVGANAFAKQMVLIIPAQSWNSYQEAGWSAYEEQMAKDKETFSMKDGQQWRTYYSKVGRTLPDGLKAYTIAGIGDAEVTTSEALDYIPAGQAVLIEHREKTACTAEAETSLLPYAQLDVPVCLLTTDEDNLLQWITAPTAVSAGDGYTLYKDEFVKVSTGTLPAGVAFLPAQGMTTSRLFIFNGEDEETGIDKVQEAEDNAQWYTLDGKKLSGKPSVRGIYLRNGQKVMVK